MASSPISKLPEELLLHIFSYLDSSSPSQRNSRQEPTLDLTTSEAHIYKNISLVSQPWRRIGLPLLFAFSRLRLDVQPEDHWSRCNACGGNRDHRVRSPLIATYHIRLQFELEGVNPAEAGYSPSLKWASRFYHALKDYLTFIMSNNLSSSVQSFVLMTDRMLQAHTNRFPHRTAATHDHRYRAAAEFWRHLFSVMNPSRVLIVAPPADLACLTNCAIDLFGDWAFGDMDYHILELGVDADQHVQRLQPTNSPVEFIPQEYPGIAESSVLKIRPWSRLALNEGSFLKAYGTYEYFERGPPSLIYSIKDCLASNRRNFMPNSQGAIDLAPLRSFTYTAILPFANHLDFRGLLPYIDELDVKLAPDPEYNILNDKSRVGKAELEDCWQEFFTAYRFIVRPFRTFDIRPDGTPKLKRFVCRDVQFPALRSELDLEFTPLCLPVWGEPEPGVFVRFQELPPTYQLEE